MGNLKRKKENSNLLNVKGFKSINGSHPIQNNLKEAYVSYQARIRPEAKIKYFNYDLAKQMGLISNSHDEVMTEDLESILIETFSLQIINEFDIENNKEFPEELIKDGSYMATRYLQLQHEDKVGKSSGDGRSIWNGHIKHKGKIWDISSCGTGATCLSPATSKYNKYFETGDPSISYGCGYGELDEGMASALFSKILHSNNIKTEETLVIFDLGKNASINVRVHENLIRPSHIFLYLKQNNLEALKSIVDLYIDRQMHNSEKWEKCPKSKRYDFLLKCFSEDMAQISADFEDEYIFCWLDWDGDNILMDGSIIDYGSIRQFGMFHHEYKFDDDDRFSTNIKEQKQKAKYMLQTMIQAVEYIKSGEKRALNDFKDHEFLSSFESTYNNRKNRNFLYKTGFSEKHIKQLLKRKLELVENTRENFSYFEKFKSNKGLIKVPDGVNWQVVFSMRRLLRELPKILLMRDDLLSQEEFISVAKAESVDVSEIDLNSYGTKKIKDFQASYLDLIKACADIFQTNESHILQRVGSRSNVINKADRVTGDAITLIVDKLIKKIQDPVEMHEMINLINDTQRIDPDAKSKYAKIPPKGLIKEIMKIIVENREGI